MFHARDRKLRLAGALAALALALAACGGNGDDAQDAAANDGDQTGDEGVTLEVAAEDNAFEPSSLSAAAGSDVTVEVTNDGENPHTFTVDDLEVDTETIDAGESANVTFAMPKTPVTFYCAIHGEDTMSGTIDPS